MLRLWAMLSPAGTLDSDMAVIGLMARHIRTGEFPVFHWGQVYGGSHEAMLGAVAFTAGASAEALAAVTVLLSGVVAVLVWFIGRETVGERAAAIAALLFWIWPAGFVWWAVKPGSDYWASLVFTLATLLVLLWLVRGKREGRVWFAVLGLLAGLAWWGNPQSLAILVPAAAWHWRFVLANRSYWLYTFAGGVVGAAPWIAFNVRNGLSSLRDVPEAEFGYVERLWRTATTSGPMALGLRVPFTKEWLVPAAIYGLFLVAFVIAAVRRPRGMGFLLLCAVLVPAVLVASPLSSYVDQPRYLLFASPVVVLLLGRVLSSGPRWLAAAGLAAALVLTIAGMRELTREGVTTAYAVDAVVPRHINDATALMRSEGVATAFADYWLAYRVTFESGEDLIVSPVYTMRHEPFDDAVRATPSPAYLFLHESRVYEAFHAWCQQRGVSCPEARRGAFALVRPTQRLLPERSPFEWTTGERRQPRRRAA